MPGPDPRDIIARLEAWAALAAIAVGGVLLLWVLLLRPGAAAQTVAPCVTAAGSPCVFTPHAPRTASTGAPCPPGECSP